MSDFWIDNRVLITGANGFLGSHLSIKLLEKGAKVIGIIKKVLPESFLNVTMKEIKLPEIKIIRADIIDFNSMLIIFKKYKPQICIHLAAQPIVIIANKSPLLTFETNIKGTWNILEAARICGVRAVIVASSDKAYGEHRRLPYTEEASLLALHPYDASKACTDILTRVYAHTYDLNTAVTRCANIYGPGDFNFSRLIPDTMRSAILDKDPVIRSDATPLRDYIFINDVVDGYLLLAHKLYARKIKAGEAFNFGSDKPISVLFLVNKILALAEKKNLKPNILSKHKLRGEIDKQFLSSQKANRILGWKCSYNLSEGLRETYKWYKKHMEIRV